MSLRLIKVCFLLLFTITPLLFLPWTSELFEFNKLIFIYLITIFISTLWVIRMVEQKKLILKKTIVDIPLLLFLLATLTSLLFSIDMHSSWIGYYGRWNGGFLSLLSYAVLYWAFVSNMDKTTTQKVLTYSLFTITITAIYGILEHFGFSFSCLVITGKGGVDCWVQDVQNRVFATLGQPNWLAAYIVALIFVPVANLFDKTKLKQNLLIFIALFACLIFTKSRSGFLAFGISSLVFWVFHILQTKTLSKNTIKNFVIFVVITICFTLGFKNPIREFIIPSQESVAPTAGTALETGGTESGEIRKIVWEGAINVWKQSTKTILLGTGPETFAMAYYAHRPLAHNNTSEWELLYNKAHNEFLNQLSTTGILGFTAYLALLITMGIAILRTKNIAIFAGWLSLSITNFWGFSVVVTQILLFLLPALAVALHNPNHEKLTPQKLTDSQKLLLLLLTITGLYLTYSTSRIWLADLHYAASQRYLGYVNHSDNPEASDLIKAYEESSVAYDLNSGEPFIDTQLADTAAYMSIYMTETDKDSSAKLAKLSAAAVQKSLSISPSHPLHYKSAARVYILLSAVEPTYLQTADQLLKYAQTLSPTDPRLPYNRGVIAKYQSDNELAQKYFNDSLKLKADFGDAIVQLRQMASDSAKTK